MCPCELWCFFACFTAVGRIYYNCIVVIRLVLYTSNSIGITTVYFSECSSIGYGIYFIAKLVSIVILSYTLYHGLQLLGLDIGLLSTFAYWCGPVACVSLIYFTTVRSQCVVCGLPAVQEYYDVAVLQVLSLSNGPS